MVYTHRFEQFTFTVILGLALAILTISFNHAFAQDLNETQQQSEQLQPPQLQQSFKPYVNSELGIKLSVPVNWEIIENSFGLAVGVTFNPPEEKSGEDLNVYFSIWRNIIDPNADLTSIREERISEYRAGPNPNFQLIGQPDTTDLGGSPAYLFMGTYTDAMTGAERQFIQSGIKTGAYNLDIIYNANADKFDKYLTQAEEMRKTFALS